MVRRCQATNAEGQPCSAHPVRPDGYCFWHSPETAAERAEYRRRGGENRSNEARARKRFGDAPLSVDDLRSLLAHTLRRVLSGDIEPGVGSCVAALSRVALAADEQATLSEIDRRLADLEAMAARQELA